MTPVVEKLVADVEALPEAQREEVIAALLRRARTDSHDLPSDDDLVAAADALFQNLDRREQGR
jgi:predicted nucleic acid-binding protein